MSGRKAADPLARLASIEAPAFLDQLVLEQARVLMAGSASSPKADPHVRASKHAATPVAALFARLTLPGLKSS